MGNNIFTLCSFFYSILLTITYFSKKRIVTYENKVYEKIVFLNIISAMFALGTYYTIMYSVSQFWILFCSKGLLVVYFFWLSQLTRYVYVIMHPIDKSKDVTVEFKKMRKIMYLCMSVFLIGIIVLPIDYSFDGKNIFTYGPSANITYIGAAIYFVLWMYFIIKNFKKASSIKSLIPIIILMICMPFILVLQKINPTLLLTTFLEGFATMVMYFTIENPDLQMLKEFHKQKELATESNQEKTSFLFNMSNQIKNPISSINTLSKEIMLEDDINVIKNNINEIIKNSTQLTQVVNNVMDITDLENRKIEIRDNKYQPANLFKSINKILQSKIDSKKVKYRFHYDNSIPEYLYGDSIRLKQIMNIILDNASEYTKEGFIEVSVHSVLKYDFCRLIIIIEDSGIGMTASEVEHLFDKEKIYGDEQLKKIDDTKNNLGIVKSLVNLMGGSIMVNSDYGKGSKFTIVIDQKIQEVQKTKTIEAVEKYEEVYVNNEKILLVLNDSSLSKKINKILKSTMYEVEEVTGGQACLEKLRNKEKFDLIIIEENLEKLSSENTLIKIKDTPGYKIPVLLLTENNEFGAKEMYQEKEFKDTILLPIKKEELLKSIKKYIED